MNEVVKEQPRFVHVAYGLRRDGSIGAATEGVPVLSHVVFDVHPTEPKGEWHWSDGSVTDSWMYNTPWMALKHERHD